MAEEKEIAGKAVSHIVRHDMILGADEAISKSAALSGGLAGYVGWKLDPLEFILWNLRERVRSALIRSLDNLDSWDESKTE